MSNPIVFKSVEDDGAPKLRRARGAKNKTAYCLHRATLLADEDTQLVTCKACGLVMSAFSALLIIIREWEHMHYDVTEYRKIQQERAIAQKASDVRRVIRELQWIELPPESEPIARSYWERVTKALGKEPHALFRRGRGTKGIQYCVLHETPMRSWSDADALIKRADKKLKLASPKVGQTAKEGRSLP